METLQIIWHFILSIITIAVGLIMIGKITKEEPFLKQLFYFISGIFIIIIGLIY